MIYLHFSMIYVHFSMIYLISFFRPKNVWMRSPMAGCPIKNLNVQECDATGDATCTTVGLIIKYCKELTTLI